MILSSDLRSFPRRGSDARQKKLGLSGLALAALVTWTAQAQAQQGTLSGRATNAEDGSSISQAQIQVLGGAADTGVLSDNQGNYRISLAAGTYDVVVAVLGYRLSRFNNVRVSAGQTTTLDMELLSQAQLLDPIVVTASRGRPEKIDRSGRHGSPDQLRRDRGATRRCARGSSALSAGRRRHHPTGSKPRNVTVRGFNNIFSGALHMLTDHRLAGGALVAP